MKWTRKDQAFIEVVSPLSRIVLSQFNPDVQVPGSHSLWQPFHSDKATYLQQNPLDPTVSTQ
jgi:hypothetical protein